MRDFEAVMVVDENGEHAVGKDREQAWEAYCNDIGWDESSPVGLRWVELVIKATAPEPVRIVGNVPAAGHATLNVS